MGGIEKETHLEEQWGKTSVLVVSWGTPRTSQTERRLLCGPAQSAEPPRPPERPSSGLTLPHKLVPQQSRVIDLTFDDIKVDWQERRDLFKFISGDGDTADPGIFLHLLKSTDSQMFGQSSTHATTRVDVEDFFRLLNPTGAVNWEIFDTNCETNTHLRRLVGKLTAQRRKRIAEMKQKGNRVLNLPPIEMEQQDLFWSWDQRALTGRKNSISVDIRTDLRPAVELVDLTPKETKDEPKVCANPAPEIAPESELEEKHRCCCILL